MSICFLFQVSEEHFSFVSGVSVILGQMPPDQIQRAMKEICWFQLSPLCQLVEVS
jgi:hypothetical protein